MTMKEKKRKLSEILGVNLFDAKFKEVDKVLSDDKPKKEEEPAKDTETSETNNATKEPETKETNSEEAAMEDKDASQEEQAKTEDAEEDLDDEETIEEGDATETESAEIVKEDNVEDTESDNASSVNAEAELFDAKLEARLLRANVREDRIDAAKKLFKADHTLADIDKVGKFIKEYPEWTKQKTKEQAKGFGMDVGEHDNSESAEERRLRELGIA